MTKEAGDQAFTDEEAKVYDRQIRLWGIQAQQQIRSADVLVVGLTGLATEVVKNLVLVGINSITLVDDKLVTDFDMLSNLFTRHQVGKNRAEAIQKAVQDLNPMVNVKIHNNSLAELLSDENKSKEFIKQFCVVVLVNHDCPSIVKLDRLCSDCGISFFSASAWGYYSMVFCNLGKDFNGTNYVPFGEALSKKTFKLKNNKSHLSKRDLNKIANYKSIFAAFLTLFKYHDKNGNFPESLNDNLIEELSSLEKEVLDELNNTSEQNDEPTQSWLPHQGWNSKICGQFTFISSIVGGFLSQEIIRSITKDIIDYNLFIFNGLEGHNLNFGF